MILPNLPASLPIAELPELARRMNAGDARAREALFLSVARVAVREALRFGHDKRLDVDDVVQEALLRLWRALPYYRAQLPDGRPAPPVPIVAAIWAGQHALRFATRERLRATRFPVGWDDDDEPTRFDLIADDDAGADAVAAADEVRTALAVLPRRWADLITMLYGLDGRPPVDQLQAARLMGVCFQRVNQLKVKAMTQLTSQLMTQAESADARGPYSLHPSLTPLQRNLDMNSDLRAFLDAHASPAAGQRRETRERLDAMERRLDAMERESMDALPAPEPQAALPPAPLAAALQEVIGAHERRARVRPLVEAMQEPEKRILVEALQAFNWERTKTAAALDINRTTLYKKMDKYGLLATATDRDD